MKHLLLLLPVLFGLGNTQAEEILKADFRERPPEMQVIDGLPSGPLISVLDTAAHRIGARVQWREAPFLRSLDDLRNGRIDIVPRVIYTLDRQSYIHYLPSIGRQRKNIRFVVRPGQETRLRSYRDLQGLSIGVKRGTAYFEPFDSDGLLSKRLASDDAQLVAMFRAQRLDAIVVLDQIPLETSFAAIGFDGYRYAPYQHEQRIDNHFCVSRRLYEGKRRALYERLAAELQAMRARGEIKQIYERYDVEVPDAP